MAIGKLNIKRLLSRRVSIARNRILRTRYFRGHGVHSPFVYSIVRDVFMFKKLRSGGESFYSQIMAADVDHARARELHNLCIYCHYKSISTNSLGGELCLINTALSIDNTVNLVNDAVKSGVTIALIAPYLNSERELMCRDIIGRHRCTTIDNRGYLLIFNNYLPKQHFKI